jgi:hypothetical protein
VADEVGAVHLEAIEQCDRVGHLVVEATCRSAAVADAPAVVPDAAEPGQGGLGGQGTQEVGPDGAVDEQQGAPSPSTS